MAKARLLAPWVEEERRSAIYHCVSRVTGTVDRQIKAHRIKHAYDSKMDF
jgi:hypothetical protein